MYSVSEDNATTLEASAFEVAQAAANLATLEREMVQLQIICKGEKKQEIKTRLPYMIHFRLFEDLVP